MVIHPLWTGTVAPFPGRFQNGFPMGIPGWADITSNDTENQGVFFLTGHVWCGFHHHIHMYLYIYIHIFATIICWDSYFMNGRQQFFGSVGGLCHQQIFISHPVAMETSPWKLPIKTPISGWWWLEPWNFRMFHSGRIIPTGRTPSFSRGFQTTN